MPLTRLELGRTRSTAAGCQRAALCGPAVCAHRCPCWPTKAVIWPANRALGGCCAKRGKTPTAAGGGPSRTGHYRSNRVAMAIVTISGAPSITSCTHRLNDRRVHLQSAIWALRATFKASKPIVRPRSLKRTGACRFKAGTGDDSAAGHSCG